MELNERIKACRLQAGMTQEQVAEALDVSRQAVTKWENGQSAPSTENLFKLAELFDTTVDMILTEGNREQEEKDHFLFLRNKNFWIAAVSGSLAFLVINPYGHDMYIPVIFTFLCIVLNGSSMLVFSILLYKLLEHRSIGEDYGMYLGFLIFCGIGHGIFSIMNWGSWVCLGLIVIFGVLLSIQKCHENRKNIEKST